MSATTNSSTIRFCPICGFGTDFRTPKGDSLPRHVCDNCSYINYQNPRLVVGCIAEYDGKILLCRRAIEPRYGFWTLPAGFMENGETAAQGALRETNEEAGACVEIESAFALYSIPHIHQVHLFYRGHLANPTYAAGTESLEVKLFKPAEIPWRELAFHSVRLCLEHYLEDRRVAKFSFHEAELPPL